MSPAAVLTPLPVLIPLIAAAATLVAGRRPRLQRAITLVALSAVVAVCAALLYLADRDGTIALHVGGWGQSVAGMGPLGITLVVDRLSALMLVVSSIVLLAVVFYAIGQGIRDGDERQPVSIFLPTYLVLSAGVCNAFLAGDLFNLFVGFEVLLAASFVLLTIGASAERVRVGISYVMVSMVSSVIFLIGIALIYAATGTLNMAEVAVRMDGVAAGTRSAIVRGAARRVRHQGGGVPAVVLAARLLPDRTGARHRGVRRPADESRCVRDHPGAHAAVPERRVGPDVDGGGVSHDDRRHPRRHRAERYQAAAVLHAGQPHRLHGVRRRTVQRARPVRRDLLCRPPHPGADGTVPGRRA